MNVNYFFIALSLLSLGMGHCYAGVTDTAYAKTSEINHDSTGIKKVTKAPMVHTDTGVVRSYNGIPVFYHCRPLHKYTRLGYMTRSTFASYLTGAFDRYTRVARRHAPGRLGIIIDNINFGTDSFDVVRFSPEDGNTDTAVFTTPIFVSAKPTKPYKVIRIIKDQFASGSLNSTLQAYLNDAQDLHIHYDGIMLRDIDYTFGMDNIFVFRWKKDSEIIPVQPTPGKVILTQDKKK